MGGGYVRAGSRPVLAKVYRNTTIPGVWVLGVLDAGYLLMVEVTVTVAASNAYAYVSGAKMSTSFTYPSLSGYESLMYIYYYTKSFTCMTGGFGICTTPVSSYSDPGFGVPSLEYSIQSPPTSSPTTSLRYPYNYTIQFTYFDTNANSDNYAYFKSNHYTYYSTNIFAFSSSD